jgi:reverse gyrase
MNYKFAFVLKDVTNSYMHKHDLSYMDFIKEEDVKNLKLSFDPIGIIYIEEDVNHQRSDKLLSLLKDNGYEADLVSAVKWKSFPELN